LPHERIMAVEVLRGPDHIAIGRGFSLMGGDDSGSAP